MSRLYLPYWEEARQYWDEALREGFHDGCDFSEDTLLRIIKEYECRTTHLNKQEAINGKQGTKERKETQAAGQEKEDIKRGGQERLSCQPR